MQNPFIQAAVLLGVIIVMNLFVILLRAFGVEIGQRFPWIIAASFVLFFAMGNSVMSIAVANLEKYWTRSILSFVGLVLLSSLSAYLFSSLSINDAGSFRWVFMVVTFGYLVFISAATFLKKVVEFAQKEEWNQPRLRRKKP